MGIIGHRLNRLPAETREEVISKISTALSSVRVAATTCHARNADFFAPFPARLAVVSALAEGSDRLGAAEALRQGYCLSVILPFPASDYENDFHNEASKREFRDFLGIASAVVELSGNRKDEGRAYEQAAFCVIDASDILIAVWDGSPSAGRGGTTELVYEAARRGMPIIRVHTTPNSSLHLHWRDPGTHYSGASYFDEGNALGENCFANAIERLVIPPQSALEQNKLREYLSQTFKPFNASAQFPVLMALLGVRRLTSRDFCRIPLAEVASETDTKRILAPTIINAYVWADEVAARFGQVFRGAFIANFILSALATILAVLSFAPPWGLIEIFLLLLLTINTSIGQRRHWQPLWIEAREVAESLRIGMFVQAVGSRNKLPFGEVATWTSWYVRALLREAGLRRAILDSAGLKAAKGELQGFLDDQTLYHENTALKFHSLHHRLEALGRWLFIVAFLTSLVFYIAQQFHLFMGPMFRHWLVILPASLTAIAAAGYGIRVIGDFEGTATRSSRMALQLTRLSELLRSSDPTLHTLRDISHRSADVMSGDVASWRLVVESRKLEAPG